MGITSGRSKHCDFLLTLQTRVFTCAFHQVKMSCMQNECNFYNKKHAEKVTPQVLLDQCSAGERSAPCVLLQCLQFDSELYQALVQESKIFIGASPSVHAAEEHPSKKRRVSGEGHTG